MKIKSLLAVFSFITFLAFISCDDDLNSIGTSIQPPSDTISLKTDTIALSARTVSMFDSVYAQTTKAVLGKYEDDIFGTIKSDYLCQFFFEERYKFDDKLKSIDSAKIFINYSSFLGDSIHPMGLTAYRVTSTLPENFYTNIDPTRYIDPQQILADEAYTIAGTSGTISAKFDLSLAKQIYEGWKNKTITNNQSFNDFLKGIYITTNLGSNNLLETSGTHLRIYYTYSYEDTTGVEIDTTGSFSLSNTKEVLQLNHIKNTNPDHLFEEGTGATYLKTPAGVFTEIELPIGEISRNMEKSQMTTINSTQFILKGYTEKEPDPTQYDMLSRPTQLLLIHKDSVDTFFKTRALYDEKTSFLGTRNSSNNTYSFGNLSHLITTYKEEGVETATFLLVPVTVETVYDSNSYTYIVTGVYNYMSPSSAILRSDPSNMRLELIYSRF